MKSITYPDRYNTYRSLLYKLSINLFYCHNCYALENMDPCSRIGKVIFTSTFGEILSPNYPDAYPKGAVCRWRIVVDPGFVVKLTFPEFNIENR